MILRYICGRRNVKFLVDTRLFTGANGNMLHLDGKMQIEMISAWGQKVSSTVCVTKGAASNLQGLPK